MKVEVFDDTDSVARAGAAAMAAHAHAAVISNGLFAMAVDGVHTPWIMLAMLAREDVRFQSDRLGTTAKELPGRGQS